MKGVIRDMASASFEGGKHDVKKMSTGIIPHDFRENKNYSNEDVDLSRSHLNQIFGVKDGDEARLKLKKRIAECDAIHPPQRIKQDRKTSLGISIPAPREDLPDDKLREFFEKSYHELENLFGAENVIFGVTHFDEQHLYIDPEDGQEHMSRPGMHVEIVPWCDSQSFVPEKYKSGLNMNNFYRRNLPNIVNGHLDTVCQQVFGFDYQDGRKKGSRGTVEKLKADSKRIEQQSATMQKNDEKIRHQEQIIQSNHDIIEKQSEEYQMKKIDMHIMDEREKKVKKREDDVDEKEKTWEEDHKTEFNEKLDAEFQKMQQSMRQYLKRWKADYKNEQEAEFQRRQDQLEAQFEIRVQEEVEK